MARQTTISVKMSRFGLGLIRTTIKVLAVLVVNASLATVTFGQDASSAAPVGTASPSWIDQVQAIRQRLAAEANVCVTVGGPVSGNKYCYGTNGFNHGGNIGSVTLSNDGLPGTISPDGNKATVGYSFGVATPDGGATGGIEYNPVTGAVKVSGGPAIGFDAPGSPLKAEISGELGVTYTPPATRPYGGFTATPDDLRRSQAALLAAREQQRLQGMTIEQKLAELTNMINQAYPSGQPRSSQYPQSAPWSAQVLDSTQMAAQMNGGMPSQAMMQPQAGTSLPPIGAGAYNSPIPTSTNGGSNGGGSRLVFDDNAPKTPYTSNGQPIVSRTNAAPNQVYATGYTYDTTGQKNAVSGPLSQSSQTPMATGNGSNGMTQDQFRASVNQSMQQFRQADGQLRQNSGQQPYPGTGSAAGLGATVGASAGQQSGQRLVFDDNAPRNASTGQGPQQYAPRNGYDAQGNRADSPRTQYDAQGYRQDSPRSQYDAQGYRQDSPRNQYDAQGYRADSTRPSSAPIQGNANRYSYDPSGPRSAVSGPLSQPTQAPSIPSVSQRAYGTQSQTAALHFPGQ